MDCPDLADGEKLASPFQFDENSVQVMLLSCHGGSDNVPETHSHMRMEDTPGCAFDIGQPVC